MSIYTQTNSQSFQLLSGQSIDNTIDWIARTIIVDNYTSAWLYLPVVQRFIAPGYIGVVIPIAPTSRVSATFAAPPGVVQGAVGDGTKATLQYLADIHPAAPGALTKLSLASGATVNTNPTSPTQFANQPPKQFNVTLAQGAVNNSQWIITPPTSPNQIYLLGMFVSVVTNTYIFINNALLSAITSAGGVTGLLMGNGAGTTINVPIPVGPSAVPLGIGNGIGALFFGQNTTDIGICTIFYSIAP